MRVPMSIMHVPHSTFHGTFRVDDMAKVKLTLDTKRLVDARLKLGLRQCDICRRLDLAKATVWRAFKTGKCGLLTARRIAKLLKLHLPTLWIDAETGKHWVPSDSSDRRASNESVAGVTP